VFGKDRKPGINLLQSAPNSLLQQQFPVPRLKSTRQRLQRRIRPFLCIGFCLCQRRSTFEEKCIFNLIS